MDVDTGSAPDRPPPEPIFLHVLDGAEEMRFVPADSVPVVVRALELAGHVVVLGYDDQTQRLAFYCQRERIPCGWRPPAVGGRLPRAGGPGQPDAADESVGESAASGRASVDVSPTPGAVGSPTSVPAAERADTARPTDAGG